MALKVSCVFYEQADLNMYSTNYFSLSLSLSLSLPSLLPEPSNTNRPTQSLSVVLFLVGILLSAAVQASEDNNTQTEQVNSESDESPTYPKLGVNEQGIEESISDLFNNSKSKFLAALTNLSSYLPLNVRYAVTAGQKCDIIKYNRPYYSAIPLILAAVLMVLGAIFSFFGK